MKLLNKASDVNIELVRLIESCTSCQIAVAWASVGFKASSLLKQHSQKIEAMVVGTHFYQTDPKFIETFLDHPHTRFVLQTNNKRSVFHPKLYFFRLTDDNWECIVGSPNFTSGGMKKNDEIAILVTSKDKGAEEFLTGVNKAIQTYWKTATTLSPTELEEYRATWAGKQPALKDVSGPVQTHPILDCSWADYYAMIRRNSQSNPQHYSIAERLKLIREVQKLFTTNPHFDEIEPARQKQIAGALHYKHGKIDGVDYLLFGSMWGAGMFKGAINRNDHNISAALDAIPHNGEVSRDDYMKYVEQFKKAFPHGRDGLPAATRLLAMKRPDVFICLDGRNEKKLYAGFGIKGGVKRKDYPGYWDLIIAAVKKSPWWNSPIPASSVEREVWKARTAFLDCLYYDGKGIGEGSQEG